MEIKTLLLLAGSLLGLRIAMVFLALVGKRKLENICRRLMKDGSILEYLTAIKKVGFRDFMEGGFRAVSGKMLDRPFGTNRRFFYWDRIQFNPVCFSRQPLPASIPVQTQVVLGPNAKKPLTIRMPIMVGGWAYGGAVSLKTELALAKNSVITGTAVNTGSGPFLPEVRTVADKYIHQYSRGYWAKSEEVLKQADMIEIALGQGGWGSAPKRIPGYKVTAEFAGRISAIPGLDVLAEARLPEVEDFADWRRLIERLKEVTAGVPIGVKIGGTHHLEEELDVIIDGGADVIVIDGKEGGTHGGPAILLDDMGLPTLLCLCRAYNHLQKRGVLGQVSLVIGGGLSSPGDFLKCLALGADAVIIGTIAALTMSNVQVKKTIPWEPPTEILLYDGAKVKDYNVEEGAKTLSNFLQSCLEEMTILTRALGKKDLREVNREDLVVLDRLYTDFTGLKYVGEN